MAGRARKRRRWGRTAGRSEHPESGSDHAPPTERGWLHPSELPPDPGTPARTPSRLSVAAGAALAGALAAFGLVALVDAGPSGGGAATTAGLFGPASTAGAPAEFVAQFGLGGHVEPAVVGVVAWAGSAARYGSAVAYRSDGMLVTSAELVRGASGIEVATPDGRRREVEVVGADPATDVAVLAAPPGTTVRADLFDMSGGDAVVTAGQSCIVVAIDHDRGRAFARAGTVRSPAHAVRTPSGWMVDVLTLGMDGAPDVAGGALLDAHGRLLGVVSEVHSHSGDLVAVPVATVRGAASQLLTTGDVRRPWLGVATRDGEEAETPGALVDRVAPGSPAERAGIVAGDVIVRVGHLRVTGMTSLLRAVLRHDVGHEVEVEVVRDGVAAIVQATLTARR